MLFNSLQFLIFLPIVALIYFVIPTKLRNYWLLVASYYFYMCWNAKYAILIFFSTLITYVSGILIEKIKQSKKEEKVKTKYKKIVVLVSFLINIGELVYFKYFNFFIDTLSKLFKSINIDLNLPVFDILLPVGISFFTFQALSYTMDVYRDDIKAEKNFFKYALFVSFFPQLVAGPIERSKNLLNQLSKPKKFNFDLAKKGILLMIWGFFLKLVIADRIAIFVDTVFTNYSIYSGWYLIVATILFSIQIYCDFYGYSIIAMGTSNIFGIELMENFNSPYFSKSTGEFWNRWHISLGSWFRDYLYFPLGGSKKGKFRKYLNKLIVFTVCGLWHGASLSYAIFGMLHGLYLILGEVLAPLRNKFISLLHLNKETLGHKLVQVVITFLLISFAAIFCRISNINDAVAIVKSIFTVNNPWILFDNSLYNCGLDIKNFNLMIICIFILFIADYFKYKGIKISDVILKQDYWFRWVVIIFAICSILVFGIWGPGYDSNGFIYFQF